MQRANKARAQDRLLLKQAERLHRSSTTNCAAWSRGSSRCKETPGYVSEQWLSNQGSVPNKYETIRYPKAASTSRRGSSAMIITEMTKMSGRGFGDLCSVISEWSRGKNARGKYQNRVFSQGMPGCLDSWQTLARVTAWPRNKIEIE